jgi:DNA uptake protein ComE-like DNA-binding protein
MINFFHQFLNSWFGFNKQQRNGLLVLCIIILILFAIRLSLHHIIKPKQIIMADFSGFNLPDEKISALTGDTTRTNSNATLFVFDPNTVNKDQLIKLGFKAKTANTLINYRNKGGHFKKKKDLKKVYGLSDALYKTLEPFILIAEETAVTSTEVKTEKEVKKNSKPIQIVELNSADSVQLLSLPGIGPGFTKRILKYRNLLGGFYDIEQLKEVYGLQDSTYQLIKDKVTANPGLIKKIDLNNENFKELNKHPYLSYDDVKAIFNYRRKNGPINSLDQVKTIFTDETALTKIKPYLPF